MIDLTGGFRNRGGPLPTQPDLDRVIGAATSVVVRGVLSDGGALYQTEDPSDLKSLSEALRIDRSLGHCMCLGDLAFVFRKRAKHVGTVTLHHGVSLRWDPFFYNARLVASDPILDWLTARGIPGPREAYEDDRRRARESAEAANRWRAAMPVALEPLWPLMGQDRSQSADVAAQMVRRHPDPVERARLLMDWFGSSAGPWSGYPSYESVPQWCLLQMSIDVLIRAALSEPQTHRLREGAARLFASWDFAKRRPDDLAHIPAGLKRHLLEHVAEDGDKFRRATQAFGN